MPYEGQRVYSEDTALVARIQAANARANRGSIGNGAA